MKHEDIRQDRRKFSLYTSCTERLETNNCHFFRAPIQERTKCISRQAVECGTTASYKSTSLAAKTTDARSRVSAVPAVGLQALF